MITPKSVSSRKLRLIAEQTLSHYEEHAERFWEGTRYHDVTQNYEAFLSAIEGVPPFRILDLGCGPGRDLIYFRSLGHEPTGLDGAKAFVRMASERSGCEVLLQNFFELELPLSSFDGVFANASLFHVPRATLPKVLSEVHKALKPRGVLFTSNPRGDNSEGFNDRRFGAYFDHPTWQHLVEHEGFVELEHYYRPPGLAREEQPWLACVFRKVRS